MDEPAIEHRHLRSAIEFAVMMGGELQKRKQSIPVPREIRAVATRGRIPTRALGGLRRAVEADDAFRTAIAAGALPELVDPVGMMWLQRPDGWEAQARALIDEIDAAAAEADMRSALRGEERRRLAAEQTAVRLRTDVAERTATIDSLRDNVDALRADLAKADDEIAALRAELIDVRNEARHARDREAAAAAKLDRVGTAPPAPPEPPPAPTHVINPDEIAEVAQAARELGARLDALLPAAAPPAAERVERRRPLRLPGGVIATSALAAEFLLRSDAVVLVDGYNVAKLAWPSRSLEAQRAQLLDTMENLARRFRADITVVFDGASVVGAHTARRRLIRTVYSPDGVIADDVIRDEVRRLPATRAVVVVTNDAEIVSDVKSLGANVLPSNALIAVA